MTKTQSWTIRPHDVENDDLQPVLDLYKSQKRTLGFLPDGAFEEFALAGHVLVAISATRAVVAYVAYRVTGDDGVLVHLCVREDHRGSGLSAALLEYFFAATADLDLVRLSCREDYEHANRLWARPGFVCDAEKVGRGSDGARLLRWSRRNRHRDQPLLDAIWEGKRRDRTVVALDANVFFDLGSDEPRAEESKALCADWLADDVVLAVTAELHNEIARQPDAALRDNHRAAVSAFRVLEGTAADVSAHAATLGGVLPRATTDSDASDRRQLAHAAAGGAAVFVTRDKVLLDHADIIERALGTRVARPVDVLVGVHASTAEEQYVPSRLAGTRVRSRRPLLEADLSAFQRFGRAERKADWLARCREVLADPRRFDTRLLEPPDDGPKVLISVDADRDDVVRIPLLRALSHPLTPTLLRRALSDVLTAARPGGQRLIVCDDGGGDGLVEGGLRALGFQQTPRGWVRASLSEMVPVEDAVNAIACLGPFAEPLTADLPASDLEARFWPLKVLGADIPSAIVPIKPHWAELLFDSRLAENLLFGAPPELALAMENVYYSASNITLPAGARILWYVSQDGSRKLSEIRACSICLGTVSGTAPELFRRFRRLGVYRWDDLRDRVGGDLARPLKAYRFAWTEPLSRPVGWTQLQETLRRHRGKGNTIASPVHVSEAVFQDLYAQGTHAASEHAAVVVSIKPEYVDAIAAGRKRVELRRRFPSFAAGMRLVIYATQPVGAVVGMARIERVDRASPDDLWSKHASAAGVTKPFFDDYFDGYAEGFAVELGPYEPIEPLNVEKMGTVLPGFRPPQSYRYMGVRELRRLIGVAQA